MVCDREIAETVTTGAGDLDTAADALIDRANTQGGPDNVTVILIRPDL